METYNVASGGESKKEIVINPVETRSNDEAWGNLGIRSHGIEQRLFAVLAKVGEEKKSEVEELLEQVRGTISSDTEASLADAASALDAIEAKLVAFEQAGE